MTTLADRAVRLLSHADGGTPLNRIDIFPLLALFWKTSHWHTFLSALLDAANHGAIPQHIVSQSITKEAYVLERLMKSSDLSPHQVKREGDDLLPFQLADLIKDFFAGIMPYSPKLAWELADYFSDNSTVQIETKKALLQEFPNLRALEDFFSCAAMKDLVWAIEVCEPCLTKKNAWMIIVNTLLILDRRTEYYSIP